MRPVFYVAMISMIACSGADESGLARPRGGETNGATTSTNGTQPKDEADDVATSSSSDQDPSSSNQPAPSTDAGAADAKPAIDPNPFAGAPAYLNTLGPSARKTQHPFTNDNPAGKPCFQCHGDNGNATPMAFGGTVYTAAGSTTGAPRVEVRVKDKDGKAISAWSDPDGNFYFFVNPNGDLNLPGHAGIRNGNATNRNKVMSGTIANGNCNGCHNPNNAGRLVAPN